jgi:cyclohexadieny/prephenate dehydrogenase
MWRDVFLHNKEVVLDLLGRFNEDLSRLARAIRWNEGETLFDFFSRTRAVRRGILEIGQDSPAADFGRPHPAKPGAALDAPGPAEPSVTAPGRRVPPGRPT